MRGAWLWARADLRRGRRGLAIIVMLLGVSGGLSMTAFAGARRADTAYERFRAETRAADITDLELEGDVGRLPEIERAVGGFPEVKALAPKALMLVRPEGSQEFPGFEFPGIAAIDERAGSVVDRVRVVEGRRASPSAADQVMVNEFTARTRGLRPGASVTLESVTFEQLFSLSEDVKTFTPAGPKVAVRVVGVFRSPEVLGYDGPTMLLTRAFYERYADAIGHFGFLTATLHGGLADVEPFRAKVMAALPEVAFESAIDRSADVEDAISAQVVALVLFGLGSAAAGAVMCAQAVARHVSRLAGDWSVARSLGMSLGGRMTAAAATIAPAGITAAFVGVALAVVGSATMPTGLAQRAEPSPGIDVDPTVFALGGAAIVVLSLASALGAAWWLGRRAAAPRERETIGAAAARRLGAMGFGAPAVTGVRLAFEPGRGRSAVPVRSAVLAGITGVATVIATLTFASSLTSLVEHPAKYGWAFDAQVLGPTEEANAQHAAQLEAHDVAAMSDVVQVDLSIEGEDVGGYAVRTVRGEPALPSVLEGRAPRARDEVALGTATLRQLGRRVGQTVRAAAGDGSSKELKVVGRIALFVTMPAQLLHFDDGALITQDAAEWLGAQPGDRSLFVRWRDGIDAVAMKAKYEPHGLVMNVAAAPPEIENLTEVEAYPWALAGFVALLGASAVAHALLTCVRRRRRDVGILKALGFDRRQTRATLGWQASALACVAIALGLPIGVGAGRTIWMAFARSLGVADAPVVPLLAVALAVPAVLLVWNLVALGPARAARRTPPAVVLRAE